MSEWYCDPQTVSSLYTLAISSGILRKLSPEVTDSSSAGIVGVLATPSAFPEEQFALARDVQPEFNSLVDAVSSRHDFLATALNNVLKTDRFTRRLFEIYEDTRHDNKQTCALGVHRCDYMLDWRGDGGMGLRQIEINTVAISLQGFGPRLKSFHKYVSSRYAGMDNVNIPENSCLEDTVDAIAMAWNEFHNREAVVLFVVIPEEANIYDQFSIEFDLWTRHSIRCVRKSLSEVHQEATLSPDRQLIMSDVPCAVVFFRAGYSPSSYPSEKEWEARLLIERSTASCCPSVAYQLVGTKKIQQVLALPGTLDQFVGDPKLVERMRSTFAGLYSLDKTPEGDRAIQLALQDPNRFVLKPQREGGGNNYYGNDVRVKIGEIRETSEREAFILMDRVHPPPQVGLILGPNPRVLELDRGPVLSELGIYGVYVRRGERVLMNKAGGHCLRTKPASVDEGGVGVRASSLDSPSLMATEEFIRRIKSS